jgi:dimethylglycine dehydrogenase
MSLRLEKGYGSWGRDYSPEYWPQESGLSALVKHDKEFLNKDSWLKIAAKAPREEMCVLEIDANLADASGSEPIFLPDGTPVGQVSSGGYGYAVGKSLALCYVRAGQVAPGDTVHVAILGQPHTARRLAEAPFDPTGLKLRDVHPEPEPAE